MSRRSVGGDGSHDHQKHQRNEDAARRRGFGFHDGRLHDGFGHATGKGRRGGDGQGSGERKFLHL
uniref:Uncharacterized protein n=1 Tax=Cereibacter sphaeroides (strain ATCC 17025 / ATH 2.4.3) TaxID=349102 RepID=A4WVV9_CERS5